MTLPNTSVQDISTDTLLSQSKSKIDGNDEDLLENDQNIDSRTTVLEGGAFVGTSRWKDEILSATALGSGVSSPDLVAFVGGIETYAFDGGATTEQLFGSFELNHDYKEGSDLRPHIHWAPSTSAAGNVKWQLEYSVATKDAVFPATTTISVTASTGSSTLAHRKNEFTAISGTGLKIGDVVMFRLFRNPSDAADTYGADAFLVSLGVHYQVDTTGSVNVFTKT